MKLTFLGTGTSFGVPVVGCDCPTCTSDDLRDRRTRHGALIDLPGGRLLVDTPPELRLQLLSACVESIDALWLTHDHADHLHGIDDIRAFTVRGNDLPMWIAPEYVASLHERFRYIFDEAVQPPLGSSKPRIVLNTFEANQPVTILGEEFVPVRVPHGGPMVYGFRGGKLDVLRGVEVLVLNALWFGRPHGSHFNIEEAITAAEEVGAETTYLTHLTHRVRHEELLKRLPAGVRPAYDGFVVEIE